MEALHGPEWKDQLAMAGGALEESEEEEEEEEEERSHYSGQGTGRPGSHLPRLVVSLCSVICPLFGCRMFF